MKGMEKVTNRMEIISLVKIFAVKLLNKIAKTKFVMKSVQPNRPQIAAWFKFLESWRSDIFTLNRGLNIWGN